LSRAALYEAAFLSTMHHDGEKCMGTSRLILLTERAISVLLKSAKLFKKRGFCGVLLLNKFRKWNQLTLIYANFVLARTNKKPFN